MQWSTTPPDASFTRALPESNVGRFLHHPLFRPFIIVLFLMPVVVINSAMVSGLIPRLGEPGATYLDIVRLAITIPLLLISYQWYCRSYEMRPATELNPEGGLVQWSIGATVAAGMVVIYVGLIEVFGDYTVVDIRSGTQLLANFLTFTAGSLLQDLVLICIVYRLLEELVGTWASLAVSLFLFGAIHLVNEGATTASAALLVFSSLIIIAPFILTRRIWFTWGFHAGWNFMQAGVFGMLNSSVSFNGWLVAEISGPEWVTGGAIGLEGTLHSVAIDFLIGLAILILAIKHQRIVAPRWKRDY